MQAAPPVWFLDLVPQRRLVRITLAISVLSRYAPRTGSLPTAAARSRRRRTWQQRVSEFV